MKLKAQLTFFYAAKIAPISYITFMNELDQINNSITPRQPTELLRTTLHDNYKFEDDISKNIFTASIQFIKDINRFNQSLIELARKHHQRPYVAISILYLNLVSVFFLLIFTYLCALFLILKQ